MGWQGKGWWHERLRETGSETTSRNSNCSRSLGAATKPPARYDLAESHWREVRPKMVAELEAKGLLRLRLLEAVERTVKELDRTRIQLMQHGLPVQQARDRAWEMVRSKYIFLPREN